MIRHLRRSTQTCRLSGCHATLPRKGVTFRKMAARKTVFIYQVKTATAKPRHYLQCFDMGNYTAPFLQKQYSFCPAQNPLQFKQFPIAHKKTTVMSLSHEAVLSLQNRQNDEHVYEIDQSTYTGNLNKSET